MSLINSFFLGIIQGIGEFLPISSSAHLYLYSYLLNLKYQGLAFDVILHLGTLFAIIIYFYRDIIDLVYNGLTNTSSFKGKYFWYIGAATIPGAVAGYLLENTAESIFRTPLIVSLSLIFFSIVMYYFDKKYKGMKTETQMNLKDAIIIGLFQAIAIIPGASRSGMTIVGAIIMGYKRHDAARISFLMAIPIIFGAGLLEVIKFKGNLFSPELFAAFLTSFISGLLSIKFLLNYLKDRNLNIFIIYRILIGIAVLIKFILT